MFGNNYNDFDEVLDLIERIIDIISKLFGGVLGNMFGGSDEEVSE